jgi:hypothetical protein
VAHDPRTARIATGDAGPVAHRRLNAMDKKAKQPKKPKSATPKPKTAKAS